MLFGIYLYRFKVSIQICNTEVITVETDTYHTHVLWKYDEYDEIDELYFVIFKFKVGYVGICYTFSCMVIYKKSACIISYFDLLSM